MTNLSIDVVNNSIKCYIVIRRDRMQTHILLFTFTRFTIYSLMT